MVFLTFKKYLIQGEIRRQWILYMKSPQMVKTANNKHADNEHADNKLADNKHADNEGRLYKRS